MEQRHPLNTNGIKEGQWFGSYGNELWEFDENGLIRKRSRQH